MSPWFDFFTACFRAASARLDWPLRDGVVVQFEPDVRQHPRPATIAVLEGMDVNCAMMQMDGLIQ